MAPGLFVLAFTPLLLTTLGRLGQTGEHSQARQVGRTALRVTIALIPLAGIAALGEVNAAKRLRILAMVPRR